MATPPTFVNEVHVTHDSATVPKVTAAFDVVAGDLLVAFSNNGDQTDGNITVSGGSLTWAERTSQSVSNKCELWMWTATVDSDKNMTVTFDRPTGSGSFGGGVMVFRNHGGFGASTSATGSGGPSVSVTATGANSALVVASADWNAVDGSSRTWRTVNSITPTSGNGLERQYQLLGGGYATYSAYYSDSGSTGSKTVGLSAPTGQAFSIGVVEVLANTNSLITVTSGSITLAGQAVTLTLGGGQTLVVDSVDLVLGGQDVSLIAGASVSIAVTSGSLTISPQDVPFTLESPWTEGTLALSGSDVTLTAQSSLVLGVTEAALSLTGSTITLTADFDYTIDVVSADILLTGQDVTFNVGSGSISLDVGQSLLLLTGSDIGTNASFTIPGSGSAVRRKRFRGVRRLLNIGR